MKQIFVYIVKFVVYICLNYIDRKNHIYIFVFVWQPHRHSTHSADTLWCWSLNARDVNWRLNQLIYNALFQSHRIAQMGTKETKNNSLIDLNWRTINFWCSLVCHHFKSSFSCYSRSKYNEVFTCVLNILHIYWKYNETITTKKKNIKSQSSLPI